VAAIPTYSHGSKEDTRILRDTVIRLSQHRTEIMQPGAKTAGFTSDLVLYLDPAAIPHSKAVGQHRPHFVEIPTLAQEWREGEPLHAFLTRSGVDYLFVDEYLIFWMGMARPNETIEFRAGYDAPGWRLMECSQTPHKRWRFYKADRASRN
jgi:hypothetical protein